MDNLGFELNEEAPPSNFSKPEKIKQECHMKKSHWSLLHVFLVCLLASAVTTVVGVLILSLVYASNPGFKRQQPEVNLENHGSASQKIPITSAYKSQVDLKFQFLHHHIKSKGTAWIGVVDADGNTVATYNVTAGQTIFFPRNTLHWVKNIGAEECLFLLFFTTHEELQTLDLDDTFFLTPKDIEARSLKPQGGMAFIRSFQKQAEDQAINLPPNLAELVQNASYNQSADMLVWRYFFDLKGSSKFQFPGGVIQWARYIKDGKGLKPNEKIYSEFLHSKEDALTLATLRISNNALRQPHFHFNANEMGYVISGCGKVGVIVSSTLSTDFTIEVGDVVFFPVGTQHYIKNTCDEDLLLILAFSTNNQLQTLDMDDYFHATADQILAQLFFKKQAEFKKIPRLKEDQAINLP
ncbi:uncharacterized protein LOC113411295 [Notechis scutatus]|uniref:Uncharacterized protein LOC113411295 n=1 Tax=Notechis scutatus TaxID=8663 RepID=A0A6J1TUH7_9SAUR|nr:uncharacterized protein LOC113411295 [Notechis scutatus]